MKGETISHYRIVEQLGEGGMGVVYKAEDTKLERRVALKFLAAHLLNDAEAKQRFLREAKAAASLDHPNICTVYEVGEAEGKTFLAMAFLKGETLEDRIAKGPLPLKDALEIGRQIAEGLEAAHEKGIVHRDIKPANVMVDAKGHATILDFGLARLTEASKLTRQDQTVGTAAYMSPEQIQGGELDHRTDIWALGCVLYEMVAGVRPFKGQYDQALAYEICNQEPEPLTGLRTGVPLELELLVGKCLAKEPGDRYQHVNEIAVDLRTLAEKLKSGRSTVLRSASLTRGVPPAEAESGPKTSTRTLRIFQGVSVVLGLACFSLAARYWGQPPSEKPERVVRRISFTTRGQRAVISPDGRYVVYDERDGDRTTLWLRSLATETSRELSGTENVIGGMAWSPDSSSIVFGVGAPDSELRRLSIDSGEALMLCRLPGANPAFSVPEVTWSQDGRQILLGARGGIYRVNARGGHPERVLVEDDLPREPHFLPVPEKTGLFVFRKWPGGDSTSMALGDFETGETRELAPGLAPIYSPAGFLIHERLNERGLWALQFSLARLETTGDSFPIADSGSSPSVSRDGALVYAEGPTNPDIVEKTLVWRNRSGERIETVGQPQQGLREFNLSPDRRRVAATVGEPGDIWIQDLERSTVTRLTFEPGSDHIPGWSASGREVVFTRQPGDGTLPRLVMKNADGTGGERVLTQMGNNSNPDWSRDGRYMLFQGRADAEGTGDILYLEAEGGGLDGDPSVFLGTPAAEVVPKLSPDGRFVAYVSNESGRREVYVQPFPEGPGRWQASVNGGAQPRWNPDGSELFYVEGADVLMAVPFQSSDSAVSLGRPDPLFQSADLNFRGVAWPQYDVSADGRRFLTATPVETDTPTTIRIVLNWYEEFRDRQEK